MKRRVVKTMAALSVTAAMLTGGIVSQAAGSYTVKVGDCLNKIAKEVYGDASKWEMIYEANKASIKNPNIIYKGQVFVIPDVTGTEATVAPAPEAVATPEVAPAPEAVATPEVAPAPEAVPTPEVTPAPETEATPVPAISNDEAKDKCFECIVNLTSILPDDILAFFDTNGDYNISQDESTKMIQWAFDNYNVIDKSALTEDEMIAVGRALNDGSFQFPSTVYFVEM